MGTADNSNEFRDRNIGSLRMADPGPLTAYSGTIENSRLAGSIVGSEPMRILADVTVQNGNKLLLDTHYLPRGMDMNFIANGTQIDFRADANGNIYEIDRFELTPEMQDANDKRKNVHETGYGMIVPDSGALMFGVQDMVRVATLDGHFNSAVKKFVVKPSCDFSQLQPGVMVKFNANAYHSVVGIEEIHAPHSGKVVSHNRAAGTYTLRDDATGDRITLQKERNAPAWNALCRGARVTYHADSEHPGEGRFVYVHKIPTPVAAFRIMSGIAQNPLMFAGMVAEIGGALVNSAKDRLSGARTHQPK